MGIPGLWAELAPAAQTTTLASYCLTTFAENRNELRGLRLGIDASLWLFHAHQSSGGANPYLRLLFYRLAKLLSLPVLPVFVFDGPNRPTWKRGKQVKGKQHAIEQPFTQLIEAFGYQWHRAPGEAEAELAYLNQAGLVDAVLTDDSDALLFGTQVLIRNWGKNLSGTKAFSRTASSSSDVFEDVAPSTHAPTVALAASRLQLSGSDRDHLITLYSAGDLSSTSKVGLDRDGLILIGLMSGGDYDTTGLLQCGVKIALALARGGFGTTLIKAFKASYSDQTSAHKTCATFQRFLRFWLEEVREELRTNQRGFLPSRRPKLASTIEESFLSTQESRRVLACYVYPLTSQSVEIGINGPTRSKMMEPDLTRLARLSQLYFNWSKDAILSKFRTILGPGVVVRRLRQEVLEHNDGAAEGPWAALVESPASKAVRRHALGVDASGSGSSLAATQNASKDVHQLSKHATVAASQKKQKQRPSHESPNATRITDFFGKAAIGIESRVLTPVETAFSTTPPSPAPANSVEIIAIKMQRRHAALDPFLDYRLLVSVEEFIAAAELGIDVSLDAELEDRRAQDNDFDSDALEDEDAEPAARSRSGTTKQKVPSNSPLLMWMPEPLLQLSASGAAPLKAFLNEIERKADATRAKELKKKVGKTDAGKGSQMTLTSFVKPVAKASLASQHVRMTQKGVLSVSSTSSTSGESTLKQDKVGKETGPPRTPRQLRVPSGMQRRLRRTESVPVPVSAPATGTSSTVLAAPALLPRRRLEKHISLPNQEPALQTSAEIAAEDDWDSSIEFLGAFVSDRRAASSAVAVHSRPSTPPSNTDGEESRPNKSPRKHRTAAPRPPSISSGRTLPPSQRALAEPSSHDSGSHSDSDDGHGETREIATSARVKSFGTALAQAIPKRPAKPRISSITISDSSSDEAG